MNEEKQASRVKFQGRIIEELKSAEAKGKAPDFCLMRLKIISDEHLTEGLKDIRIEMELKIDGHVHNISKDLKVVGHDGSIGLMETFNLLEECFHQAISNSYPRFNLESLPVESSYVVHTLGNHESKSSDVVVHYSLGDFHASVRVTNGGVDWSCAHALCRIYKWILWRMLRAERGHARKMSQKKK